jgi:ankyrin repeat protein
MRLNRPKTHDPKAVRIKSHPRLTAAVLASDYDATRQIIAAGANPNEFDESEMTPLLWAIMRGDITAVRMLLENGADPDTRPNPSDSPLWSAEDDFGLTDDAKLLGSYGATK